MKDGAMFAFTTFQTWVEAEAGRKIGTLRMDHGGEFTTWTFAEHCARHGVQWHLTVPYNLEQNGVVERRNQSVLGMARSMLKVVSMPSWLWGEFMLTVAFILNRSPTQSVDGRTPHEVWHGTKPSVTYLRTFGYDAHVKQGSKTLTKVEDRSTMMLFIGYESGSKAWRFYNSTTKHVHVSRDVIFEEGRAWEWNEYEIEDGEPFQMEYVTAGGSRPTIGDWPPIDHPANSPARTTPRSVIMSMRGSEPCTPPTMEALKAVKYATPLAAMPNIDVEAEGAPLRFRTMADLLGAAPQQDAPDTQLREELLVMISDELNTVEVAMKSKAWHAAMMDELG
jgi:hypothetical protein